MTSGLVAANTVGCTENRRPVIAVRVSGGHLCEAEAPTEPAGETAEGRAAIRSFLRGITDSFALCAQNDTPFSCHECRKVCAVSCCLVIAKVRVSGGHLCKAEAPTEPTGETQSDCGNPFFPL